MISKMLKRQNKKIKKAQMEISFNLIFAIILIVIFIVFGFFGIKKFIDIQEDIQAKKLVSDVQNEIKELSQSPSASIEKKFSTPKNVEKICFEMQPEGSENPNFYSIPKEIVQGKISGVNWNAMTPDLSSC
jgi:uncharacterized protein (UPF0333 family)